jgi:hypothetical protein
MGHLLPEKLMGTCATLAALSILTFALRCYVRTRIVKMWGLDDTFISMAFVSLKALTANFEPRCSQSQVIHMWYAGTLMTGIHYGTGQRTSDISVTDSVHAMRVSLNAALSPQLIY